MASNTKSYIFQEDTQWMDDLPSGGELEKYRRTATFCWKHLRMVLEDPDKLRLKVINLNSISTFIIKFILS